MKHQEHYKPLKKTLEIYLEYTELLASSNQWSEDEFFAIENNYFEKISENFYNEYLKILDKEYFLGCSHHIYEKTYIDRLQKFQSFFKDSNEIDFIKSELDAGIYDHAFKDFVSDFEEQETLDLYNKVHTKITYSLTRRFEYLQARAIHNSYELLKVDTSEKYTLKFNNKKVPQYLKLGVLVAQNKIKFIDAKYSYEYEGQIYHKTEFEEKLQKELGIGSIRQYLDSTYRGVNDPGKDLIKNRRKIKEIIQYCDSKRITVSDDYRILLKTIEE